MKKKLCLVFFLLTPFFLFAQSEDSIVLSLKQTEAVFLKKNLLLLSARYRVSAAQAEELQTQLYNNPELSSEISAYSNSRKWLDAGAYGQKSFGIDQLVIMAGKRNKRALLAKEQTHQEKLALYELLRTLKYELRLSFFTVLYANELIEKFDEQIGLLKRIIDAYDEQTVKKNVPLMDAVRLKTEYIQLSADRNAIVMESINAQQILQLLTDTVKIIVPQREPTRESADLVLSDLLEKARQHRTDVRLQESRLKMEELNYQYQKSLAIPDLTLGIGYDQSGGYVPHLFTLRAGMELPVFNRNQGNIKAAAWQIKVAETDKEFKQKEIAAEIQSAFSRLLEAEREFAISRQNFDKDFPDVNRSVIENFSKGNISLLEFIDFFENYNSAIRQVNQLQKQRRLIREELEYIVGAEF